MQGMVLRAVLLVLATALAACADTAAQTAPPPPLDLSQQSMVLIGVVVTRPDASRYVPRPERINLLQLDSPEGHSRTFGLDRGDAVPLGPYYMYLARLPLDPGRYRVCSIEGSASASPYHADFEIALLREFEVTPHSVSYAGRISAKLRPRTGTEFRAGPVEPAPDQTITGMAEGTWDVAIENRFSEDVPRFRQKEPALASASIATTLLPAFDREVTQRFSELRTQNPSFPKCPAAGR